MVSLVLAAGCGKPAASSSSEAIQHARTLKTPEQQADYLVSRAQAFMNSKDYQEAVKTAQYVLASIDVNSQAAKELLEQAKTRLAADTKSVVDDTKKRLGL
jgi:hypothetical protein